MEQHVGGEGKAVVDEGPGGEDARGVGALKAAGVVDGEAGKGGVMEGAALQAGAEEEAAKETEGSVAVGVVVSVVVCVAVSSGMVVEDAVEPERGRGEGGASGSTGPSSRAEEGDVGTMVATEPSSLETANTSGSRTS